jgi:WD40 repeat protein
MSNSVSLDPRLVEALARYESLLLAGREVPVAELCPDAPELIDPLRVAVEQLRAFRQRFQDETLPENVVPGPAARTSPPGYTIERELGTGGMGVVYLARQEGLERPVALKMIRPAMLTGADELARFVQEARVLARLRHPHIVQVFDIGTHQGQPFFSLEYCSGGSLARKLAGTPLPARDAARLVEQLAGAVAAAHAEGVLHRDMKPSNVLIDASGAPKITDFGLAYRLDADSGLTRTGVILGTPAYMAPEQARGDKALTVGVDVWALGAILYECLTGRPPFKGATVGETLEQVRTREPVPPRALAPSVPRDLETICLKCLRKEPGRRYASAAELAADLQRFLEGRPIQARPVGAMERAGLWVRRNPGLAGLLVVAALGVLATVVVSIVFAVVKSWDAATLAQQARDLETEVGRKKAREVELERMLLTASLRRVGVLWRDNPVEARQILADPRQCPPAARDFAWGYLRRLTAENCTELATEKQAIRGVAWLPDDERVVAITRSSTQVGAMGAMRVWNARTGQVLGSFEDPLLYLATLAVAPEGKTIVTGSSAEIDRAQVILWDLDTLRARRRFSYPAKFVRALATSRTGRFVVAGMNTGEVVVWDLDRPDAAPWSVPAHKDLVWGVAITDDGNRVASCCTATGTVCIHDRQENRVITCERLDRPTRVTFLDSEALYITTADGLRCWLFREQPKPTPGEGRLVAGFNGLDYSPGRDRVAVAGTDQVLRVLDVDGRLLASLPRGSIEDHVALDRLGQRVVIGTFEGKLLLWHWAGQASRSLLLPGSPRLMSAGAAHVGVLSGTWFYELAIREARPRWQDRQPIRDLADAALLDDGLTLLSLTPPSAPRPALQWWDLQPDDPPGGKGRAPKLSVSLEKPARLLVADREQRFVVVGGSAATAEAGRWDGWTQVRSLPDGKPGPLWSRPGYLLMSLALSADGRFVLSGWTSSSINAGGIRAGVVELRERESGEIVTEVAVPKSGVVAVACAASGPWLAWADETGQVTVWDRVKKERAATLRGHRGRVHAVAFAPDGRQLASGGLFGPRQGEIRLWQIPTWQEEAVIELESRFDATLKRQVEGPVRSLLYVAGGQVLAVGTDDGQVRFLSAEPLDVQATP